MLDAEETSRDQRRDAEREDHDRHILPGVGGSEGEHQDQRPAHHVGPEIRHLLELGELHSLLQLEPGGCECGKQTDGEERHVVPRIREQGADDGDDGTEGAQPAKNHDQRAKQKFRFGKGRAKADQAEVQPAKFGGDRENDDRQAKGVNAVLRRIDPTRQQRGGSKTEYAWHQF